MFDISTIISVISGILLTISEILPFFKNLDSNGIIHLLVSISKNKTSLLEEIEPLLINNEECHCKVDINLSDINNSLCCITDKIEQSKVEMSLSDINNTLSNITNKFYENLNNIVDNSRTLKLQPSELYELSYIINYIKLNYPKKSYISKCISKTNKQLLVSQGYIIDYDVHHDTYTIKW